MPVLKRYLAFGYDTYYPGGGWSDLVGSYDTVGEAVEIVAKWDLWEIVDLTTGEIVKQKSDSVG